MKSCFNGEKSVKLLTAWSIDIKCFHCMSCLLLNVYILSHQHINCFTSLFLSYTNVFTCIFLDYLPLHFTILRFIVLINFFFLYNFRTHFYGKVDHMWQYVINSGFWYNNWLNDDVEDCLYLNYMMSSWRFYLLNNNFYVNDY